MQAKTNTFRLSSLPTSARIVLTLFLVLVGLGYLSALGNLYHQHQMADGKEGLTIDDLRVVFHGMAVPPGSRASSAPAAEMSRMKQMVQPGGDMRKNLAKGGAEAIRALETWLDHGALESEFTERGLVQPGDPSADDVIARHCLRCHNAEDGEKADTPYGPDLFATDYKMVYVYAAPGTAREAADGVGGDDSADGRRLGPHTIGHLFLITHIHMLSIPVFTLIVSALFLLRGPDLRLTAVLGPLPMLTLVVDFASWWLALRLEVFVYVIAAAGGVFGVSLAAQLLFVLAALWDRREPGRSGVGSTESSLPRE